MTFFRLTDNINDPIRWHLGEVIGVDNWPLVAGRPVTEPLPTMLNVELYRPGRPTDFTLTAAFGVPIVSDRVRRALDAVDGISFLPVTVEETRASIEYFILIIERTVDCVDESRSIFEKFLQNDPVRPDMAGDYRAFTKLRLDDTRAREAGASMFRLRGFETAIIIDSVVRESLERSGAEGAVFTPVSGDGADN